MSNQNLMLKVMFAAKDGLSGTLRNIVGLGQSGSEKLSSMKKEARDVGKALRDQRADIASAVAEGRQLGDMVRHERELREQLERTNREIERQTALNRRRAQAAAMRQRGEELRSSGTGMVMAGAAMAAPGVVAAKQAMTFESAMADVRKVVDFDSPKQFQQMGDDIVDMSTKIPMAAEGLAQIVAAAGRAGVGRKELLTFAQDAAQMGIAFDTTAEDAGNMMAKWRTAFGMGQNEVRGLSDQINALTNIYGGNVGAVAGVVTRIGSLGKVAGLAAPQIASMAQLMNSVGVEEEVAATGIKNMMLAMTKGGAATKAQSKAFATLGLDAKAVAEAMQKDAGGAITDLLGRIRKLPQAQQAATLTQLFGSESVSALAPMLTNLDKLQANFELVGDKAKYAGSMNKEYLARIATTEGAVGLAGNALKGVNITLGTLLLPTITAASAKVVELANGFRDWAKENPGLAKGLAMAWVAAAGLVTGLGALKFAFGLLLSPLAAIWSFLPKLGPVLSVARFAFIALGRGAMQAGTMMLANPIVAVIVGIVAALGVAGYLIYKHWDTIFGAFKQGWHGITSTLSGAPAWLATLGSNMMQGLLNALNPALLADKLLAVARSGIAAFKNFFGIKSPSRLMMAMGGYITEGLSGGINKGAPGAIRAARGMAAGVAGASFSGAAVGAGSGHSGSISMQFGPVAITVNAAPGQSPQEIAQAVKAALANQANEAAAARRSSYTDD